MEFIINSEISFSKSSQNTDFGHKITVIPLYQNDGYSLAEKEGFEFPRQLLFITKVRNILVNICVSETF